VRGGIAAVAIGTLVIGMAQGTTRTSSAASAPQQAAGGFDLAAMNSRNQFVSRAAKERVLTPQALAQSRSQRLAQDAKALADGREAAALQTRTASLDTSASQIRKQSRLLADRSNFLMPTGGGFDGRYGMRLHPILGYHKLHNGDDIGGACGQPIWAAHDGEVIKADTGGYHGGSGNNVRLDAGKIGGHKVESAYLHMNSISVKVGQKVHKGELLGTVGNTGLSTACHLHFSVYQDGKAIAPKTYLKK